MFPTGIPGAALLLLRLSVATGLLVEWTAHWTLATPPWVIAGLVLLAICLYLGFLTPYCSSICCIAELAVLGLTRDQHEFHLVMSILTGAVLAMLGPGAYSIDARIFGRRLLTLSPRDTPR